MKKHHSYTNPSSNHWSPCLHSSLLSPRHSAFTREFSVISNRDAHAPMVNPAAMSFPQYYPDLPRSSDSAHGFQKSTQIIAKPKPFGRNGPTDPERWPSSKQSLSSFSQRTRLGPPGWSQAMVPLLASVPCTLGTAPRRRDSIFGSIYSSTPSQPCCSVVVTTACNSSWDLLAMRSIQRKR